MFLCDETFNVYITLKVHFVSFVMIIIIQQQQQPPQQQQQNNNTVGFKNGVEIENKLLLHTHNKDSRTSIFIVDRLLDECHATTPSYFSVDGKSRLV